MNKLNDKVQEAYHLAKQLEGVCNELYKDLTEATKAAYKATDPKEKAELVGAITDFEFVKSVMKLSSLTEPLAMQLKEVYMSLGLVAFTTPGFLEKVNQDIENSRGQKYCNCPVCKAEADDVLAQAEEIVKKASKDL